MSNIKTSNLPCVVYSPDTGLRNPVQLITGMWHDAFCHQSRSLAWRLFIRNISAQFRQSLLGYFWLFFPPLVNSAVFIFLNSRGIVKIPDTGVPYPVFVLLGNLLWQVLIMLMQAPIQGINREKGLLTKLNFSREALLVASFLEGATMAMIPLAAVPLILLIFGMPFGINMLLAPLGIFGLCIFAFSIGVFLTPIGTLYQDIGRAIPVVARFWMFVTPVIYALPKEGKTRTLLMLNPATPFIETARDCMLGHPADLMPLFALYFGLSVMLLAFGLIVYRLAMPIIVERMSA
jgi:lipopolysaccharide transport system permease protein